MKRVDEVSQRYPKEKVIPITDISVIFILLTIFRSRLIIDRLSTLKHAGPLTLSRIGH